MNIDEILILNKNLLDRYFFFLNIDIVIFFFFKKFEYFIFLKEKECI